MHPTGGAVPIRCGMGAPYRCKVPGGMHLRESAGVITAGDHRERVTGSWVVGGASLGWWCT